MVGNVFLEVGEPLNRVTICPLTGPTEFLIYFAASIQRLDDEEIQLPLYRSSVFQRVIVG